MHWIAWLLIAAAAGLFSPASRAQTPASAQRLPATPQPQATTHADKTQEQPCEPKKSSAAAEKSATTAANSGSGSPNSQTGQADQTQPSPCPSKLPIINWYNRFLNGPEVKPFTPIEKLHLAGSDLINPFNLLTITGEGAISVAADSHSPVGPGLPGYGRYIGISFTEDMTGEFFGTFLIPSIAHQDPHYHRMPKAGIPRRAFHTVAQVFWTQGDNGKPMINYAVLGGFAIDEAIGNLYIPDQQTHFSASLSRYGIALATAPVDNIITEFLPSIARHIHTHVVLVQRIVNQVAITTTTP